jgi:glycine reductase
MEQSGMPAVLITNLVSIATNMKVNRFISGVSIPHLLGNPSLNPDDEKKLRRDIIQKVLTLLTT